MRAILVCLAIITASPSQAFTCEDVRRLAQTYTRAQLIAMARSYGLTQEQIRAAAACLSSHRK